MFDSLHIDEKRLLVQLPYRIGLYISESDQTGGNASDAQEKQTLSNIIHGFAQDVMGAESIQHIISTTIFLKDQWHEWGEQLDQVPAECEEAAILMRDHVSEKDARAFSTQMYEIGEAVALAFKEYEEGNWLAELKMFIAYKRMRPHPAKPDAAKRTSMSINPLARTNAPP